MVLRAAGVHPPTAACTKCIAAQADIEQTYSCLLSKAYNGAVTSSVASSGHSVLVRLLLLLLCAGSYYNGDNQPYTGPGAYYDYSSTGGQAAQVSGTTQFMAVGGTPAQQIATP